MTTATKKTVTTRVDLSETAVRNVYSLQRARRGDLWFILSLIIPLSIIPVTVQMGSITTNYLILNWVFFEINIINSSTFTLIPFWLQKNPLYIMVTIVQVISIIFAIGVRIKQEFELDIVLCTIFGIGWFIYAEVIYTAGLNSQLINSLYFTITVAIISLVLILILKFVNRSFSKSETYDSSNKRSRSSVLRLTNYILYSLLALFVIVAFYFVYLIYNSLIILHGSITDSVLFLVGLTLSCGIIVSFIVPKRRFDKIVESGSIGMFAFIIIIMELIHIFLANYEILENFYDTHGLNWLAEGATVSNSLIPAIPIIPQHIIFSSFDIVLPIQYILILSMIPFGLVFTVLWTYQEYRAFPAAFEKWIIRFVRITIILSFVIISIVPLIWIFFVSFNTVAILKGGFTIWPIDFNQNKVTLSAWMSFLHFRVHPPFDQTISYSFVWTYSSVPEHYTVTLPVTGFLFTIITILLVLLMVYMYMQRKKISTKYDNLGTSGIHKVSFFIIISELVMVICTIFGVGWYIYAEILQTSDLTSQLINSGYFTIITAIISLVLILIMKFVNKNTNIFDTYESSNKNYKTSILRFVNYTLSSLLTFFVLVAISFLYLIYHSIFILQSEFTSYIWFVLGIVVSCGVIVSFIIPKYNERWFSALESYFLEYGVAFNLAIFVGFLALLFGLLSDVSYDWIYHQGPTNVDYQIGEWFFLTIGLCTVVGLVAIILASLSSYAFSSFKFHGRNLLGSMILSTQIFPGAILALTLYIMMAKIGLTRSLVGLGFAYSVIELPFVTYLLKGFFDAIPVDLEEQAMVDGCTRTQAFWRIAFPLVLPGIVSTFIFAFLAMYTEYLMALLIYQGDRNTYLISLAMLNVFTADQTQRGVYYNDLAVYAILVALPIIAGFVYLQRYLLKGLVAGSTKG